MVEAGSTTSTRRLCGLSSASPRPNFPTEDKLHNLRVNVVDPIRPRYTTTYFIMTAELRGVADCQPGSLPQYLDGGFI